MDNKEAIKEIINLEEYLKDKMVYIVLEDAPLKMVKFKAGTDLLNSDSHQSYIKNKLNDDFSKYRPDITHQCLLTLLDSPLNKAGCLKVYIRTFENVLIEIDPSCKIPRTFNRFSKLFAQLLENLKIRAVNTSKTLLKVVKNPVTDHLPTGILKIGTSTKGKLVNMRDYTFTELKDLKEICFVVGAVSKGNPGMENNYIDTCISVSSYPLSASNALFKIIETFEQLWNIN